MANLLRQPCTATRLPRIIERYPKYATSSAVGNLPLNIPALVAFEALAKPVLVCQPAKCGHRYATALPFLRESLAKAEHVSFCSVIYRHDGGKTQLCWPHSSYGLTSAQPYRHQTAGASAVSAPTLTAIISVATAC